MDPHDSTKTDNVMASMVNAMAVMAIEAALETGLVRPEASAVELLAALRRVATNVSRRKAVRDG